MNRPRVCVLGGGVGGGGGETCEFCITRKSSIVILCIHQSHGQWRSKTAVVVVVVRGVLLLLLLGGGWGGRSPPQRVARLHSVAARRRDRRV